MTDLPCVHDFILVRISITMESDDVGVVLIMDDCDSDERFCATFKWAGWVSSNLNGFCANRVIDGLLECGWDEVPQSYRINPHNHKYYRVDFTDGSVVHIVSHPVTITSMGPSGAK